MTVRLLLAALVLACTATTVRAQQPDPIVRVEVEPQSISVGESARLQVTVLVPTWQPRPPVFPSFEVPDAIVRLPADSSYPTSERVGAETWSGIIRNYQVTPLVAARFTLGGQVIRVTYADPGAGPLVADVPAPSASLLAEVPAGAAALNPYLAGTRFELSRTFNRDPADLLAGDALVVRYEARLEGMPALFIPPLTPELQTDLATAYPAEPEVTDGAEALRSESVTLILQHGGDLELPAVSVRWWNTSTGNIETASVESMTLAVAGPSPDTAADTPPPARSLVPWAAGLLLLLIAAAAARRRLPAFIRRRQEARARHRQSEPYRFKQLLRMRLQADAEVYAATVSWLRRLDSTLDLRTFAHRFGDQGLQEEVEVISAALFGNGQRTTDRARLFRELSAARRRWLRHADTTGQPRLVALNP